MGMDHTYDWRTTEPGDDLVGAHRIQHAGDAVPSTRRFDLQRRELSPATMRRILSATRR